VLLEVVDETAGGADQDVASLAQGVALLVVVDASVDRQDPEPGMGAEQPRVGLDLHDQLPRRGDDQHPGRGDRRGGGGRVREAAREGRDQERGGLAGAGLGLPGHVLAAQGQRQRRLLDRGRGHESRVLDAAPDRSGQVERGELERAHFDVSSVTAGFAGGFRPKMRAEMMPSS
jgi:hypothetical protein